MALDSFTQPLQWYTHTTHSNNSIQIDVKKNRKNVLLWVDGDTEISIDLTHSFRLNVDEASEI